MIEFPMSDLPGFLPPTAEGHGGTVRSLEINGLRVLVLLGRTHGYEGHPVWRTVHAVRTAAREMYSRWRARVRPT